MINLIDRNNRIPSMKSILQSAGIITNIYVETATDLIISITRSNKVIRLTSTGLIFMGTAWTTGTTLTDQRAIVVFSGTIDPFDWAIIITPNLLSFVFKAGNLATGHCYSTTFTTTTDGIHVVVGFANTSNAALFNSTCFETDSANLAPIIIPTILYGNGILKNSNDFYYTSNLYFKYLDSNIPIESPVNEIRVVLNGSTNTQGYYKFGNDVVVNGWTTQTGNLIMAGNFLIPNGVV